MDIEKIFSAMANADRRTRSKYHLTLGGLIEQLGRADPKDSVIADTGAAIGCPDSYRGYYADLAFAPSDQAVTVSQVLEAATAALGMEFTGYKGGEFVMGDDTPLWLAGYGNCGLAIVGVEHRPGHFVLLTKDTDA